MQPFAHFKTPLSLRIDPDKNVPSRPQDPCRVSVHIMHIRKTYFGINHAIIHLGDVSQANHRANVSLNLPCASNDRHKNQRFEKTLVLSLEAWDVVNKPVMIPAPALSLVLIASGVAIGLESPPLPALEETGQ